MFKLIVAVVLAVLVAAASAKPAPQLLAAYTAPEVFGAAPGAFAPYATTVASREFHGASPYYASAPYIAAPAAAYSAYSAYPYYF